MLREGEQGAIREGEQGALVPGAAHGLWGLQGGE